MDNGYKIKLSFLFILPYFMGKVDLLGEICYNENTKNFTRC